MMKKLLTVITLIVLSASLMASAPIDLTMNVGPVTKTKTEAVRGGWKKTSEVTAEEKQWAGQTVNYYGTNYTWIDNHTIEVEYTVNEKVPTTHTYTNAQGTTGLSYTVTKSERFNTQPDDLGVNYDRYRAQTYFTTTTDVPEGKVLAVQFLGAEIEKGNRYPKDQFGREITYYGENYGYDKDFKVQDYGIYLYNPETGEKGEWLSVKDNNNYFGESAGIKAGTSFGVYFKDKDGNYITTTDNVVGNFDDDSHVLKTYDKEGNVVPETTDKHFLCVFNNTFESGKLNQTHWEFMLQTTLDNPYFPVNPNDFGTDVHIDQPIVDNPNGQPLPGTLATILISGLCAGALRKRNKK